MLPKSPTLASFYILSWLIFRPSVWQRYVAQIDPQLLPHFALANLKKHHWSHPALKKLLFCGLGLWPLWVSLVIILLLWALDKPGEIIIQTMIYSFFFSLIGGFLGSLTISLAFGIMVSALGSILMSLPIGFAEEIIFNMAKNIAVAVAFFSSSEVLVLDNNHYALLTVILAAFTAGFAGNIMYSTSKTANTPPAYRQVGSIVVGVVVSGLVVPIITVLIGAIVYGVTALFINNVPLFTFVYDGLTNLVFGTSLTFIYFLQTWRWRQSLWLGLIATLIPAFITLLKNQFQVVIPLKIFLEGAHGGTENAMLYLLLFAFPYALAKRISTPWAGIIAGIFGSVGVYIIFSLIITNEFELFLLLLSLGTFGLGITVTWWYPLFLYPFESAWNILLYHTDENRLNKDHHLLKWHSAFWDEHQYLPLFGLENYLVLITERHPKTGQAAIEQLSTTPQCWAAQEAQIELDARRLEKLKSVKTISTAHRLLAIGELSSPVSALLRSFSRLSRDVEAALSQESNYNQRLALDAVEERLDGLLRELTRSSEPYARRFRPIAEIWRQTIADYTKALGEAVESRQEISNPYIIGVPLTEHQEIFVGRSDISERIEKLLLDYRCPPLLLYGQRRTGKTSLLNNLGKLLPWQIIPLFVDLQGPTSLAKNSQGFLYNISRAILTSAKRHRELQFIPLSREHLNIDPFTAFDEWLDQIESHIDPNQTLLLILDEFSALEHVFNKGFLDEESILGMFRHIIQHRSRIKILLSGSHTIDEFERWASYLINVQVVHIGYLQFNEALQLIEHPIRNFTLCYEKSASQRILEITRCHPALIQLICSEIVTLKNKQNISERRLVKVNDVEAAIPSALQHGRFFFADIANNQITPQGLKLLRLLASQGEGAVISQQELMSHDPETYETSLEKLFQRELIEPFGEGYRFQVELIRHWFA